MENTIIVYSIKISIALTLFYGVYIACMRKDTFFKLRRGYFLFAILFSLIFPLFNIILPLGRTRMPMFLLSEIELDAMIIAPMMATDTRVFDLITWFLILVFSVSILLLLKLAFQLLTILRLKIKNKSDSSNGYNIIWLNDKKVSPFSFFNWIFLNPDEDKMKVAEVITHEKIHVSQLHSLDVMLVEFLSVFFWWNPIVWLLRREVKLNLEYLADQGVLENGYESRNYQYLLLQLSNKNTGIPIINNFNVSQLKKRIVMMNKKNTQKILSLKYLLIIPLCSALLLANAVQASSSQIEHHLLGNFDVSQKPKENPQKREDVYKMVEQLPTFPGGEQEMFKFISDNLKYPKEASENGIQGCVFIQFIVEKTGEVSDVVVLRSLEPTLDAEALRVVKLMPNWSPGKHNGKIVPVYFALPIVYKLSKSTADEKK